MDTIRDPMLTALCGGYLALFGAGCGIFAWCCISDWRQARQARRIADAEAAEKAAVADLMALEEQLDHQALEQEDRKIAERMNAVWPDWHVEVAGSQFYPPLGPLSRPPSLPSIHEAFGLPNPPTYPGDLPPAADVRPQWERDVEEIVRARWDA